MPTQKKQVFKNKRKNASYVSILFLKNFILCFSNPFCGVFDYFRCFCHTLKMPDLDNLLSVAGQKHTNAFLIRHIKVFIICRSNSSFMCFY